MMVHLHPRRVADCLLVLYAFLVVGILVFTLVELARRAAPADSVDFESGISALVNALVAAVGWLIARRQPRNAIGWLLLAVGNIWAVALAMSIYGEYGINIDPGSVPAPALAGALVQGTWVPAVGLMAIFVPLLFPDGHLPSPGWRWFAWLSGAVMTVLSIAFALDPTVFDGTPLHGVNNPLGIEPDWVQAATVWVFVLFPVCMIVAATAAVLRYRRATGVERLQMKWLVTAGAIFAWFFGLTLLLPSFLPTIGNSRVISDVILPLSFTLFPVAIGVAVLRYRLYDIDVVINKALVFGLLAAFITVVYVAIVVGVGTLADRGDRPNIVLSIAATTVVAVAFQPVRKRVERFANRLVYGRRATPYEVLSDFADRVGGAYDAAALLPVMARTVAEGLDASHVEVWLATGSGLAREASWPPGDPGDSREGGVTAGSVPTLTDITGDQVIEVRHSGELLGALAVTKPAGESLRPAEVKLLDDVAAQAGLVLRNVRLVEELRGSRERLMSSQDDERRRLERRLHDGAQHRLDSVASMIAEARSALGRDPGDSATALDQLTAQLHAATEELSELARGIHPAVLTDLGLAAAVRALADRAPVPVGVDVQLDRPLSRNVEATLYFVASEALTNVAKYAHATSIVLTLSAQGGYASLEVADDGIGGLDETRGSGVRGLRDRVAAVDGTIEIRSPLGAGTRLLVTIPLGVPARSGQVLAMADWRSG